MSFSLLCSLLLFCSCSKQNLNNEISERKNLNVINAELIESAETRSEVNSIDFGKGYLCTSETSSLKLEVYPNENNLETSCYMVDNDGNVLHLLKFKIDSFIQDGICNFTASNEFNEPIMSGVYDTVNSKIEINNIYGNDVVTRASVAAWGCGLAMGLVGGVWSTAAGMVSMGAGFVVGMSYTAMAIATCDGL